MRFLFVDKIIRIKKGAYITGKKTVSFEECFLSSPDQEGYFPRLLIFEAVAQLASWLICYTTDFHYKPVLLKIDKAELFAQVQCGTSLLLEVEILSMNEEGAVINGQVKVADQLIALGTRCLCHHVPLDRLEDPDDVREQFRELTDGAVFL
ncbi:MAG: hypothetical protein ACMUJM_23380 [bacterium]